MLPISRRPACGSAHGPVDVPTVMLGATTQSSADLIPSTTDTSHAGTGRLQHTPTQVCLDPGSSQDQPFSLMLQGRVHPAWGVKVGPGLLWKWYEHRAHLQTPAPDTRHQPQQNTVTAATHCCSHSLDQTWHPRPMADIPLPSFGGE